jgi:hypothetical protein
LINKPILITGLPRSGTSMVAGCIELCGAFGGDLIGKNRWNKKGFFENNGIRDPYIKEILKLNGFCERGVKKLPAPEFDFKDIANIYDGVISEITRQGYGGKSNWFFKDPKLCLVWPVWNRAFPDARIVVVRRNKNAVMKSVRGCGFMERHGLSESIIEKWHHTHDMILDNISKLENALVVNSDKLVSGDFTHIKNVVNLLGLEYNPEVEKFIDNKLWHY